MPTDEEKIAFSDKVEDLVWDKDISYLDAMMLYCQKNDYELEVAATLCTSALKDKIADDCNDLNLLKTKVHRIPGL